MIRCRDADIGGNAVVQRVGSRMLIGWLLCVSLAAAPLYIYPSGNPQISDYILAGVCLMVLAEVAWTRFHLIGVTIAYPLACLTVWVFLVQLVWLIFADGISLLVPLYFLFNLLVVNSLAYVLIGYPGGKSYVLTGTQFSLLVSAFGIVVQIFYPGVFGSEEAPGRITGFFNNPNQLAYFSLCATSIILVLKDFRISFRPFQLLVLAAGFLGIVVPTSLAAWGGLVLLLLAIIVSNLSQAKSILNVICILPVFLLVIYVADDISEGAISQRVDARIERSRLKLDDVQEERHYDRMLAFPQHWFLGAGSGRNDRFYPHDGLEIHSSLGWMLFSFGLPGLIFLLSFFWRCLRNAPMGGWLVFGVPMLYGLTHMGLRSTTFWILMLVLWYCYGRSGERVAKNVER